METNDTLEVIQRIPLDKLRPYPDHPFGVRDDDMMQQTVESIKQFGVLVPGIARPLPDGTFELIAGHRRKQASAIAGLSDMPIIVRDIDRNAATIIMVDSNLQRENILPSEKAKAYKMKLEAIKRQAGRPGKNSAQVGQNFEGKSSRAQIAENSPDSSSQIQRYIRLNELEPELMQLVDEGKIGMTPAVEISYLKPDDQRLLIETIDSEQAIIICDPEAEYGPLVERLHGQVIRISPTSPHYINPMDLNLNYSDEENPLSLKSDFILSLCELIVGGKEGLQPVEKTVIDRCVRLVYRDYLADPKPENMPILEDLYNALRKQEEKEAHYIATALEIYVTGSLSGLLHFEKVPFPKSQPLIHR